MSLPILKTDLGTRTRLLDFIVTELKHSRSRAYVGLSAAEQQQASLGQLDVTKRIKMTTGVQIGDPITKTGTAAKADGTDFYGLALNEYWPSLDKHSDDSFFARALIKDAEVKEHPKYTAAIKAAMVEQGIAVITTGA